jgi:hypothetical protein
VTTYTYPLNRQPVGEISALAVFADSGLTVPATVTDTSGNVYPDGHVPLGPDGQWPLFQSAASVLYTPAPDGVITTLYPTINPANPPAITGSRGANAALANLLMALAAGGIIVDNTTA